MNFADKKNIDFYEKIYNDGQNHQYPNLDLVRIHHTHLKKNLEKFLIMDLVVEKIVNF